MTKSSMARGNGGPHSLPMIQFPRSSTSRNDPGHLRIITHVDRSAPLGLQLRGRLARTGSKVELEALPRPAVVLEDAGRMCTVAATQPLAVRRRSFATLWILWRFDFDALRWIEVVRMTAQDASYSLFFTPVVERLLGPQSDLVHAEQARATASKVISSIEAELAEVSNDAGCFALAQIEAYLANQIVRRIEKGHERMIEAAAERFFGGSEVLQLGA